MVALCQTKIYCVICDSHDHLNHKCPLLKQPRPVAHAVGYAVHGLSFYHIPHPPLPKAKKDSRAALITVVGVTLTREQIIFHSQNLVPIKWNWELKDHEQGFVTQFPSKVELQRSITFGAADVKIKGVSAGMRLQFSELVEKEDGFLMPKVWVRVFGIRKSLREFLNLWAVGSMLGSTQAVDMEVTRNSDFGRIFIAVLNPKLIPSHLDVVIGDHYFELKFEVEKIGVNENGNEVEQDLSFLDDEEDKEEEDAQMDGVDPDLGRESLRSKNIDNQMAGREGDDSARAEGIKKTFLNAVEHLSEEEFKIFLMKKAEEIIGISVDTVLGEITHKVIEEKDDQHILADEISSDLMITGSGDKSPAYAETLNLKLGHPDNVEFMNLDGAADGGTLKEHPSLALTRAAEGN